MRRVRRVGCAVALIACVCAAPTPASAVTLTGGCAGQAASFDADHVQLMAVTAPSDAAGTKDDPFRVDYDGTVEYAGNGPLITTVHYELRVLGIPVTSGDEVNESQQTASVGSIAVADYLPFRITGVYFIEGKISGDGNECVASGFVKLIGSPVGTIPWIVAIGLVVIGAMVLWSSFPRATPSRLGMLEVDVLPVGPVTPPAAPSIAEPIGAPLAPNEFAPFAPEPTAEQRQPLPPPPSPPASPPS